MLKRVYLEITNSCNLNCPFCTNSKGQNYLNLEDIDDYTTQIKKYTDYIYLHILGEPTLHPDFEEILNILDKKRFKLQLVTNGTLLSKYPNLLNHQCLRKIAISIHSVNNIKISDNYFDTINDLIKDNQVNIELRFYDQKNLSVKLKKYLDYLTSKYHFEITSKENSYKLKENTYLYFEQLFKWPNINDPIVSNNGYCHGAKEMIAINSNKKVTICCLDPYAHNEIGDLNNNSLDDILNSQKYKEIITNLNNKKLIMPLCQKCTYRLRFDK